MCVCVYREYEISNAVSGKLVANKERKIPNYRKWISRFDEEDSEVYLDALRKSHIHIQAKLFLDFIIKHQSLQMYVGYEI
jgi:hypothetical protein